MIGQEDLRNTINKQIADNTFPHFSIIVGDKGSGKKTLIDEIYKMGAFNSIYKLKDVKIDSIRDMITDVYKLHNTLYVIADVDDMSINAKNSLLKVVEECPNNNYFIMTLENENNTLETIRSRASIYKMEDYTNNEIKEYAKSIDKNLVNYVDICSNLGQVELLSKMKAKEFYAYVESVVENIAEVSGANAFKIADKIALKDEEDKYDLKLFWKTFMYICKNRINGFEAGKEVQAIQITSDALKDLRIKSLNRGMLFDNWILSIRKVWL